MAGDGLTHANLTELYPALPPNWRSLGNSPLGRRSTVMVPAKEVRREEKGAEGLAGVGRHSDYARTCGAAGNSLEGARQTTATQRQRG
jgi:hypothetical protein